MLTLAVIVAIAVAAIAGYEFGLHRRRRSDSDSPPQPPTPSAPSPPIAPALPAPAVEAERIGAEKARIVRSMSGETDALRRELTELRADNARYRRLVIDIENNAPPPILSSGTGPDDLKLIVGIGPVLERMLHNLGVMTFQQIARWTDRDVAEFDARLPEFPGRILRDQWVTQAKLLHQATYGDAAARQPPERL